MEAIFFPRNDYPNNIEVCDHRYGKAMTFTEQTDKLRANCFSQVMELASSINIRVGAFCNNMLSTTIGDNVNDNDVKPWINNGTLWLDIYWRYVGMASDTVVDEQTYRTNCDAQIERFLQRWGRLPIAMSYALGNTSYKNYTKQDFLGARQSGVNGATDYGISYDTGDHLGMPDYPYSKDRFTNKFSTYRFYNSAENDGYESAISEISSIIDATKLNHGWCNNFTHWHEYIENNHIDWMEGYFALLASKNIANDIHFAGYGEAVAYLVYRTLITKVVMYSPLQNANSRLIIRLECTNTLDIDTSLLQIPISVKFSTVGTPLENQTIKCENGNLINLDSNEYLVEIPYSRFPYAIIDKLL